MFRRETYVCEVCTLPCRVLIDASDEKLPRGPGTKLVTLCGVCLCNEGPPRWTLELNEEIM